MLKCFEIFTNHNIFEVLRRKKFPNVLLSQRKILQKKISLLLLQKEILPSLLQKILQKEVLKKIKKVSNLFN